jgi:xylulokinase
MPLVIGVDSSTQSVKVEVRDLETGAVVGSGRASHPATTPPRSEQNPSAWWSAFVDAVAAAFSGRDGGADPSRRGEVVAISIGGQQHGMVVLDESMQVIRPAKLWNDTESAAQAAALVDAIGAEAWADSTGSVPVAAFTVTKLAWLRDNEPANFDRVRLVMLPHDWLTFRLSGQAVTDRGDASGTGYWSPVTGTWAVERLSLVDGDRDWTRHLPAVLGPRDAAGPLLADVADALGLPRSVVVGPGTGDNMAAALGIGLGPGDVAISLGTSGTVFAVADAPTADVSGCVAGFADATGHFLPLVCTLNATKVTDLAMRFLDLDHEGFDSLVASVPVGAGGLTLVPYLDGERTPNRPSATGTLTGLRSGSSRADFARASVEGVACGLLDGLDALRAAGVRDTGRVFLIGGGAKSGAYRQVFADLLQRPVVVPASDEHVATGAAVQAAVVFGGASFADVISRWNLGGGASVMPLASGEAASEVRARYAVARG